MKSLLKEMGSVQFPAHTGERIYMQPFTLAGGLPAHLSRWQPTIDAMLGSVQTDGPIYLMIDQGFVKAGASHRRGGPHIDGNWNPGISAHSGGGGRWFPQPPTPKPGHVSAGGTWGADNFSPEALILASDVTASCAYVGDVDGDPVEGGSCAHLDLSTALRVPLLAGKAYAGNVTMIHESLPVETDCLRTLVRLNIPGVALP